MEYVKNVYKSVRKNVNKRKQANYLSQHVTEEIKNGK